MPRSFITFGEWQDLDVRHSFRFVKGVVGGPIIGGVLRHKVKGAGVECEPGLVQWEPCGESRPLFSVASTRQGEPISVTPFIVCEVCGDAGFISRGKWVAKEDEEGLDSVDPMRLLEGVEGVDGDTTAYELQIRRELGDVVLEEELTADRALVDASGGPQLRLPPQTEEEIRAEHDHVFSAADDAEDGVFEFLTPLEWMTRTGIHIVDPDGWRTMTPEEKRASGSIDGLKEWDVPIGRAEFIRRASECTVSAWPTPLRDEEGTGLCVEQSDRVKTILRENADRIPFHLRVEDEYEPPTITEIVDPPEEIRDLFDVVPIPQSEFDAWCSVHEAYRWTDDGILTDECNRAREDDPRACDFTPDPKPSYVEGQGDDIGNLGLDQRLRTGDQRIERQERSRRAADREVKDSGHRHVFETGAERDRSAGKGRFDLLQWMALPRVAVILEKGADKYEARNWEKGMPISRFVDSAARHLGQYVAGETDEDHLGQAAWNLLSAIQTEEMIARGILPAELNDLPTYDPDHFDLTRREV